MRDVYTGQEFEGPAGERVTPSSHRHERPKTAPAPPPPASGLPARAALPVGVRDGDVLVIGVDSSLSLNELDHFSRSLREALGVQIKIVAIQGGGGTVTVLRPER